MLQLHNICKQYKTGDLVQTALNDVSLNLRDNEFVAILGPSGSGKSTMLNIIGGLDRYDSGDLIINGISTKKYTDRDWDSYRNHTIGFVFQSYNLIPHQTVLANVELALTISGISRAERRKRAQDALREVGLGDQMHKKPNQMSGGQMQRVAIARALVNNPDILLADEPTGALDTETSIQVMELLKEVARDRLVVMVTHNPELAEQYATRIVRIQDGVLKSDSDPYVVDEASLAEPEHKNMGHSSMSFLTSLSLSLNNLATKKTRTFMTAFAGSIGIIGIALILSISTGVNDYIQNIEEETMSEYPIQITSSGFDLSSIMSTQDTISGSQTEGEEGMVTVTEILSGMFTSLSSNDIAALKEYLDSGESGIESYVKGIEYIYDIEPQIYIADGSEYRMVNPNSLSSSSSSISASSSISSYMSLMTSYISGMNVFYKMPENEELYINQYEVKAGRWPENYDECVLVLTSSGSVSDLMLYMLGLEDYSELEDMMERYQDGEDVSIASADGTYSYDDILGITFQLITSADYYAYDSEYEIWVDKSGDTAYMNEVVANGEELTIVGIVQPVENASSEALTSGINYPASLIDHIVEKAAESDIVKEQMANSDINVLSGEEFGEETSDFDLSSILNIDEDALAEAFDFGDLEDLFDLSGLEDLFDLDSFTIDEDSLDLSVSTDLGDMTLDFSELDLGDLDLSDMDLSDLDTSSFTLDMSDLDLSSLLSGIKFTGTQEDLTALMEDLIDGYWDYVPDGYEDLEDIFTAYLGTDRAQEILGKWAADYLPYDSGEQEEDPGTEGDGEDSGSTGNGEDGGTTSEDTASAGRTVQTMAMTSGMSTNSGTSVSADTGSVAELSMSNASFRSMSAVMVSASVQSDAGENDDGNENSGESGSGTGEENPDGSGSGTGEENPDESGSGTGEENPDESGSGTGEENPDESGSGTGEENPDESGSGTGEENPDESGSGTGEENPDESGSGTGEENPDESGGTGEEDPDGTGSGTETEDPSETPSIDFGSIDIDAEALSELASDLLADFVSYMEEEGFSFTAYLSSDTSLEILMNALVSMIDTSEMEAQLTSTLETAITDMITSIMTSMTTVISDTLEEQMTVIMEALAEQIEEQVSAVITEVMEQIADSIADSMETAMTDMMDEMTGSLEDAFQIDADTLSSAFEFNLDSESLAEIMSSLTSSGSTTYSSNLSSFGYVDFANPSEIDIYPTDFKSKEKVIDILDAYNQRMEDEGKSEQVITYTDTVGLLMSSVTTIIDVISYVLIAFVSVSLIVSSIMIGIITYISVLERTREIGILRAIGASKNNISQIFNAETLIVGFCAGAIGIGISYALLVPINYLIHHLADTTDVSAVLMPRYAVILVILSMVLTLIGGLIPSASAAKKDPVTALRTD